jgi:serine O-acetyltransferase
VLPTPEKMHAASHWLAARGAGGPAKLLQALVQAMYGLVLPPEATVGAGTLFAYRGTGVVVHSRAVIGRNCLIGPGVTIGGRSRHRDVPVIGDDVFVGAGARVLGPVHVGSGSVIGANAVVIEDVPASSMVGGVPARILRRDINVRDYTDLPDDMRAPRGAPTEGPLSREP